MADDKRPLLNRQDDGTTESEHENTSGVAAPHTRPQGSLHSYGTWDMPPNARQEADSLQSTERFTEPAPWQPPEEPKPSASAPTVAIVGNSNSHHPQGLSINITSEDTFVPESSPENEHLPKDSYQNSNYGLAPHCLINSQPSGATSDLHQRKSKQDKPQDTHSAGGGFHPSSNQHPIQTQENANTPSSPSAAANNLTTVTAPSRTEAVERFPRNIINQLQRSQPVRPGLTSRATTDQSEHYSQDDREPLHATGPDMEHAHFTSSKKPVPPQDKDEKTPFFVYYLACFATIGGLLFGYDTGIVSGAMLLIKDYFHLSTLWQELIVSATVGSAAVFSLLAGFMCDRLGRKITIMIASVVFVVGAVIMGAAENKEMLMAGRIVVGIGIGFASMTVPVYVAEAAPPAIRGRLVTLNQLFITIGILISSIIAGAFSTMKKDGWRYMLALAGVPAIVQFVGFIYLPESPRWLVVKGREEQAIKILQRIRGKEDVQAEVDEIKEALEEDKKNEGIVLGRVFSTPHVRKALFVGCVLQVFQQLCGINTVIYYSATILKMAGFPAEDAIWLVLVPNTINFLSTISGVLLVERLGRKKLLIGSFIGILLALAVLAIGFQLSANYSPKISWNSTDINNTFYANDSCYTRLFSNCEACIEDSDCGFCFTGDGANGKCLHVLDSDEDTYSNIGNCNETNKGLKDMTFSHGFCPTDYTWMAVLGLALFVMAFAPGLGPMPWTINSEIYPMWARSTGNSLATGCNWIFNLLVSLFFLTLTEAITKYGAFWLFAGICLLGLLFTLIFLPETKNKTLEQVEDLFRGKNKKGSENLGYEREIPAPDNKDSRDTEAKYNTRF